MDKVVRIKTFNIAKNPEYDGCHLQSFKNFCGTVKKEIISNKELVEDSLENLKKEKYAQLL